MQINIRPAEKKDCPRMMELVRELALYERAPEEVTVSPEHFEKSGFGPNPVWWAYVAEMIGEDSRPLIVGFALYYIRYSTWKGQRMYLEDIIVTEAYRGKGIGKMLFDKLLQVCKEKDFKGMTWQVLDWNEPALNFYRKYKGVSFDGSWLNGSIT
jgi:ribosomal protein S18 acetylase RimI-like enzyme